MPKDEFYLQDSRSLTGNCMMFFKRGGCGYTSDVTEAEVYSRESAQRQHNIRDTDIPWPKDYIDALARPRADFQYASRKVLKRAGITIKKPERIQKERFRCNGCQRYMRMVDYYGTCRHCGTNNMP